ncbi:UNKNOWN [Stylonychia lemnae]|uniref:Uncharacterized protein n=1 Tax=Stylonychia lemnae TaxID=5949 RepID=A0A078AR20_STYLE|nr:UNKNOWN [Stylonychia lemnae]|eukprot:CDW84865.1 UNKNOWN [Stylonychia lemnae]
MASHLSSVSTIEGLLQHSASGKGNRDYWNIDDILAEEESAPTIFLQDAKGLAYLNHLDQINPNSSNAIRASSSAQSMLAKQQQLRNLRTEVLKAETKVELPLWLGIALAQRDIVNLLPPKYMTKQYFNTLNAGSEVVTMRQQSPYIYENVTKICEYMAESDVKDTLVVYLNVFIERFGKLVIDYSNNSNQTEQFSGVQKKLTNLERELFDTHKKQKLMFQAWKNREGPSVEVNTDFIGNENNDGHEARNFKRLRVQ